MLLHNNVVADLEPESSAFSSRFRCKERIEHFLSHLSWNACTVVADSDLHPIAKVFSADCKDRFIFTIGDFTLALGRRIKAI